MQKVAVVTGGSSGLGFEIAKRLAGEGHAVVLIARGPDRLEARKKELEALGRTVLTIAADVSNIDQMQSAAEQVRERFGRVDFLAINAGIVEPRALFTFHDLARMKKTIDVDLWGAILTSRVFGPMVVEAGRILFVSSAFGLCGGAGYATYCGAKAGVINFADALRHELSCRRIKAHVLGGKLGGGVSLGPVCRVAGEIEESIFQGFANKRHHGFVGHSIVGAWVNLGALTTTSDLKNNYGPVRVSQHGRERATGETKIGAFLGDHVKTAIGTLLTTGTVVGPASNLVGGGTTGPKELPRVRLVGWRGDGALRRREVRRHGEGRVRAARPKLRGGAGADVSGAGGQSLETHLTDTGT